MLRANFLLRALLQPLSNNKTTSYAQQACINLGKTNGLTQLQSQIPLTLCFSWQGNSCHSKLNNAAVGDCNRR